MFIYVSFIALSIFISKTEISKYEKQTDCKISLSQFEYLQDFH